MAELGIDEIRSKFKDFFQVHNIEFFSLYEDYFAGQLGIESVFDSCMSANNTTEYTEKEVFNHTNYRIRILCDKLI